MQHLSPYHGKILLTYRGGISAAWLGLVERLTAEQEVRNEGTSFILPGARLLRRLVDHVSKIVVRSPEGDVMSSVITFVLYLLTLKLSTFFT